MPIKLPRQQYNRIKWPAVIFGATVWAIGSALRHQGRIGNEIILFTIVGFAPCLCANFFPERGDGHND
ncbi:MAG: hypothetical protein AAGA91_14885 [Pseudomonadota bacterium]